MKTIARTAVRIITPMRLKLTQIGYIDIKPEVATIHAIDALRGPIEIAVTPDDIRWLYSWLKDAERDGKLGDDE